MVEDTKPCQGPTLVATAWGASRGPRSPVDKCALFDLRRPVVPRLAYHVVGWREPRIADGMGHRFVHLDPSGPITS
jgi:hypothetical protein